MRAGQVTIAGIGQPQLTNLKTCQQKYGQHGIYGLSSTTAARENTTWSKTLKEKLESP